MMTTKNPIYWQDEILQILFWMQGERLGEVVTLEEINRFLTIEKSNLNDTVKSLVEMGYLELSTNSEKISEVQLTEQGKKEGKSADDTWERQRREMRAPKVRSLARGVWGHAPLKFFEKIKAVGAFWGHSGA